MKMQTEKKKSRAGIYAQMSVEATAAGTGFAPKGEKSPVANSKTFIKREIEDGSYLAERGDPHSKKYKTQRFENLEPGPSWRAPNRRSPNPRSPNRRSYCDQLPNRRSPNPRSSIRRSPNRRSPNRRSSSDRSPYRQSISFDIHHSPSRHLYRRRDEFDETHRGIDRPRSSERSLYTSSLNMDRVEKSLPAVSNTYIPYSKAFKKQLSNMYNITAYLYNKTDPFGKVDVEYYGPLLKAVDSCLLDERGCKIGQSVISSKTVLVRCLNEQALQSVERNIAYFNQVCPGHELFLSRKQLAVGRRKISVVVQCQIPNEDFLHIIKRQNDYPTEIWTTYHRIDKPGGMKLIIGMDSGSYDRLRHEEGLLYFCMDRIQCVLKDK